MRKIISFAMKNKLAVWILTLIVIVGGVYAGTSMKMETMPNFTIPVVSVSTVYQGAPPEEVDSGVTKLVEQKLRALPGVQNVSTTSSTGMSSVIVEYDYNQNMDKAVNDIKEAVDQVTLPDQAQKPSVARISMDAMPVYALSVSDSHLSLDKLSSRVTKDLLPELEGVDGVSSVSLSGQQVEDVQISFKPDQLKKYGLAQDTVVNLIKGNNVSTPLGLYTIDKSEKSVVVSGNIHSADDLKKIRIPYMPQAAQTAAGTRQDTAQASSAPQNTAQQAQAVQSEQQTAGNQNTAGSAAAQAAAVKLPTVQLSDVADVQLEKKAESISRTNGEQSIGLTVTKGQDANTVDVVNKVKEKVASFEKDYPDSHIEAMMDQGKPIEQSVRTMVEKAIFGALFAMLVILLFLRNIRTTLISVLSIPLSLLIALIVLKQMNVTLNIMTLGALTIAIGRVVDDSIVVIENIYRRMSLSTERLTGTKLIREATHEMFIPILSSTIVTIAVFLPMAMVTGVIGQIFLPFALTIVFALLASLLVAITLVPMLSSSLFKNGLKKKTHSEEKPSKLASGYRRVLNGVLNHKLMTFAAAAVIFAASLFLIPHIGASFMPEDSEKQMILTYNPDPGQTVDDTKAMAVKAEKYLETNKNMEKIQYSIGGSDTMPMFQASANQAMFFVTYKSDTPDFEQLQQNVVKKLNKQSDHGAFKAENYDSGSSSNTLTLYVYGDSLNQLRSATNDVLDVVKKDKHFTEADSSLSKSYDQYTISADGKKLGENGVAAGQIAQALMSSSSMGNNQPLTTITRNGDDLDVYVKASDSNDLKSMDDLTDKTVTSAAGKNVKIADLARVEQGSSPQSITKRDGKLYAEITAKVTAKDVSGATSELQKKLAKQDLPDGASVSFSGVTEQMNESFSQLGMAMLAAILIVYFVLVVTFGGGLAPFAILFSLPFAIIGSLAALFISGETINVSSMIGALMLIGIVVTNAVVLIDRVIHKEKAGLSTREALLEAAGTRIRPILMTAIATICALMPLAVNAEGSGGLISKGLAVTVIGGLTSSTILTLLIVPIVYEALMKLKAKMTGKRSTPIKN